MNRKKRKTALILLVAVLCAIVLLGIRGTRKTIDKTVPVRVYEDNSTTYTPSSITISGTLKKTWSSTNFVGTFAMENYEPSCRDGVEAKINWGDNEYPILTFFYAGDFSQLDVKSIDQNSGNYSCIPFSRIEKVYEPRTCHFTSCEV